MAEDVLVCGNCGFHLSEEEHVYSTPNWRLGDTEAKCPECGNRWVIPWEPR